MQNKTSFIISGIIAITVYLSFCLLVMIYIFSPTKEQINITPSSTTIELEMIEEIAEKKMVQKK
ncbi:hypothetical protein ACN2CX_07335 [Aliarcobacter butzleri]